MGCSATYFYGSPSKQSWQNVVSLFAAHNDLKSEKTSTLPLVQFWSDRDIEKRLREGEPWQNILQSIGDDAQLCFEYAVSPKEGSGKASMTDLMIIASDTVIAIEAKYKECAKPYETIQKWNKERSENKSKVLKGWLKYISAVVKGWGIDIENDPDIQRVPYQLIHRIASACKVANDKAVKPMVVYQLFYDDDTKASMNRFAKRLHSAFAMLGLTGKIPFHVIATQVTQFPDKPSKGKLNDLFLEMLNGEIYAFGESRTLVPATDESIPDFEFE